MWNVTNIALDRSIASSLSHKSYSGQAALTIGAIGVVLGNIGTSPLYAVDQIFYGPAHIAPTPDNVLGCISLVIWALTLIVSLKYAVFILRADNDGEGGVFALYSLLHNYREAAYLPLLLAGLMLGAGFLCGDSIISPAISVLAAVEGLEVATPMFRGAVIPITVVILALLFAGRQRDVGGGAVFGPVLIIWFIVLAVLGVWQFQSHPDILRAFNPAYAVAFLRETKAYSVLITLGALMLVVTGGEAMYADLGHSARFPIRRGGSPSRFRRLFSIIWAKARSCSNIPRPIVANSSTAWRRANSSIPWSRSPPSQRSSPPQGLISASFSLTSQAVSLGRVPRLRIIHTHHGHEGHKSTSPSSIGRCSPVARRWALGFRSTEALAALYGLAVSGVMVVTSAAMIPVGTRYWGWTPWASGGLFGVFTLVNALFCVASSLKLLDGGYIPLGIGLGVFAVMLTGAGAEGQPLRPMKPNVP